MHKEPERRYASAAQLRDDIGRHRDGKPIISRADSVTYRLTKLAGRHRTFVVATTLIFLSLAIGFVMTSIALRRAQMAADRYHEQLYVAETNLAFEAYQRQQYDEVQRIEDRLTRESQFEDLRGIEWDLLRTLTQRDPPILLAAHKGSVTELALVPGKPWVVSVGEDAMIHVWHVETGDRLFTMGPAVGPLQSVAVSPDGTLLATGCKSVELWDLVTRKHLSVLQTCEVNVESLAFAPNGKELAIGVRYHDVSILSLDGSPPIVVEICRSRHERLTFLNDGRSLVIPTRRNDMLSLNIWDCESKQFTRHLDADHVTHTALSSDGKWLAGTGFHDGKIHVYEAKSGNQIHNMWRKCDGIYALAFSANNSLLAGACDDGNVVIWRFMVTTPANVSKEDQKVAEHATIQLNRYDSFRADDSKLRSIVFADNERLVTGGNDGIVRIWPINLNRGITRYGPEDESFVSASVLHNPEIIAGIDTSGEVLVCIADESDRVWQKIPGKPGEYHDVAVAPTGDLLAIAKVGTIDLIELKSLTKVGSLIHTKADFSVGGISFSSNGKLFASTGNDKSTCLWDIQQCRLIHRWCHPEQARHVEFCPKSRRLAIGTSFREVQIMDVSKLELLHRITVSGDTGSLAWSPDGCWLGIGQSNGEIILFNTNNQSIKRLRGYSMSFSPDSATLVSGGGFGEIRLWHVATGRPLGILHRGGSKPLAIAALSFSPESDQLLAALRTHNKSQPILSWDIQRE